MVFEFVCRWFRHPNPKISSEEAIAVAIAECETRGWTPLTSIGARLRRDRWVVWMPSDALWPITYISVDCENGKVIEALRSSGRVRRDRN